jgi:uncharacterized OB-fold protein
VAVTQQLNWDDAVVLLSSTGARAFPDPRPTTHVGDDGLVYLVGRRCTECAHPLALPAPWCPRCRGELTLENFGPRGVVWSSTVLRVPLPGRTPPYGLAYVDLADGPRVLGHYVTDPMVRLPVGAAVELTTPTDFGDVAVRVRAS